MIETLPKGSHRGHAYYEEEPEMLDEVLQRISGREGDGNEALVAHDKTMA